MAAMVSCPWSSPLASESIPRAEPKDATEDCLDAARLLIFCSDGRSDLGSGGGGGKSAFEDVWVGRTIFFEFCDNKVSFEVAATSCAGCNMCGSGNVMVW